MNPSPPTLSPALAVYVLAACVVLFFASGGVLWFLVVIGVAIVASYVLRSRLPLAWLPSLLLAGFLLGLAILLTPVNHPTAMIGDVRPTLISGQATAILALIQFYRPVPADPMRPSLIAMISGSLILLGACSTYEENFMRVLVPVASLLMGVALRGTRQRRRSYPLTMALVGLALCATFGIGAFGVSKANEYRDALSDWGNKLVGDRQFEVSGMAQQPTLGPLFGLRGSTARVLRLEGRLHSAHLRGLSYDTYNEGRWWPLTTARAPRVVTPRELNGAPLPRNQTHRVSVTLLATENNFLYAPLNISGLEINEVERIEWFSDFGGPLRARIRVPFTYVYEEGPENLQGVLAEPALTSQELRRKHLVIPDEIQNELRPIARRIVGQAASPTAKVAAITEHLLKSYPYSLQFSSGRGDPVVRFLTESPARGAHCELFASSAALLLRCVGVPTRYVTGYFAHETQEDGSVLVRQRDAHAWCEAWIEGVGWVVVEATPPTGWPENDKTPVEFWRHAWEYIQDLWLNLLAWLATREAWQLVLIAVAPLLLSGLRLLQQRQKRVSTVLTWQSPPPELKEYAQRLESFFVRNGVTLIPTKPWSEQLGSLPEELAEPALRFISLYSEARFGSGQASHHDVLEAILLELEKRRP